MFPNFARFFEVCRGVVPYAWQKRLADRVLADRRWPDALNLPTGSGKTSAIDIALYALAVAAHEGKFGIYPRRIILVVDRRVLVDQAWRHGNRLLERIETHAELVPVKNALARLSPERPSSVRLRGACPTDPRWCRSPDQVQIIASTVDQIGSRLLLRGYGVTPRMRSVEAGLVGQDTLLLLDEAHLAGPFLDTLHRLECLEPVRSIPSRRHIVQLGATPAVTSAATRFELSADERNDPALGPRLTARKTLCWSGDRLEQVLATVDAPCVLLVANTVRTALDWFKKTTKARAAHRRNAVERESFLVTGRMRPLDRQRILDSVEKRLNDREPTLVVATQCIEAGVDWDFDAMISECASWDALVQRMGRVNRCGERDDALCVILQAQRTLTEDAEKLCPVYGQYERRTANWLEEHVSPARCSPGAMPKAPEDCVRPPMTAPLLLPEYLDLWSQNRADGPAYDVTAFLHGVQQDLYAYVVWRNLDLFEDRYLEPLLKALPPSNREAVPVPLPKLREWLDGKEAVRVGAEITIESARNIGVGDTVVVPTGYGGIGSHGTFDGSTGDVPDVSSEAMRDHRGMEFQIHDAPSVDEDESVESQVESWIAEDDVRSVLQGWTWIDIGRRWLFVSALPSESDDDWSTFQRRQVSLESHLNGVSMRTRTVAERLGLLAKMTEDLVLAARLHDVGKLDSRFQRLCGRKQDATPLAQSGHSWIERRRRAAESDYPKGERHEALSVELMIRHGLHKTANDAELVEHLVASHHGWSRPFIRAARGIAPITDRLFGLSFDDELTHGESERAPVRFRSVQKRFGWLGLAWLEAIVRLSDHRQVEAQNKGDIGPVGGEPLAASLRPVVKGTASPEEIALTTLNGLAPGDYLAALGVLRALDLDDECVLLRWKGTQPRFTTSLGIDEIVERLVEARRNFRGAWPTELNKLTDDQRNDLLLDTKAPFRSLVLAMLSPAGRSDMDFVSGGRSGFKPVFEWLTTDKSQAFSPDALRRTLVGPRHLINTGKSFRWSPLAAQGARRPQIASNDKRTEPWIEWLSMMGVSALVCIPKAQRDRLVTRSTGIYGYRWDGKQFRWPLWRIALAWPDVTAALAGNRFSLRDALWCEALRLPFGTKQNRQYGFGAGQPCWT